MTRTAVARKSFWTFTDRTGGTVTSVSIDLFSITNDAVAADLIVTPERAAPYVVHISAPVTVARSGGRIYEATVGVGMTDTLRTARTVKAAAEAWASAEAGIVTKGISAALRAARQ